MGAEWGAEVSAGTWGRGGGGGGGERMRVAGGGGVRGVRDARVYAVGDWNAGEAFEGFSAPPQLVDEHHKIGRFPSLGKR